MRANQFFTTGTKSEVQFYSEVRGQISSSLARLITGLNLTVKKWEGKAAVHWQTKCQVQSYSEHVRHQTSFSPAKLNLRLNFLVGEWGSKSVLQWHDYTWGSLAVLQWKSERANQFFAGKNKFGVLSCSEKVREQVSFSLAKEIWRYNSTVKTWDTKSDFYW